MKILFCIYQLDYADHISLSYLSAIAKRRGHATYFCTLPDFDSRLDIVRPDLVAYSLNIYGFNEVIAAHKRVRKKHSFISIGGGPQATFNPEVFATTELDAYCIGEGELAFDEFLSKLETGASYDTVLNLMTPRSSNDVRPWIECLDTLPFPDRDLVLANSFLKHTEKKTFYTTRGCPYSCFYCANNYYNTLYKGKGKIIRRFSVDRIIEEIQYVNRHYTMNFVKFGDDLFALKADAWLEEFARKYKNAINKPFNCFLRFDTVNHDLLQLLRECNCYSVHLSVDSLSENIRENVLGRKMKPVDITQKLKLINSYGLKTWVNFMLAAPDSTLTDDLATIDMGHRAKVSYLSYTTTVPTRGTALFNQAISRGLIDLSTYSQDLSGCGKLSQLRCFSEADKQARYNIYLLGALISKLPSPFRQWAIFLLTRIKPNRLFLRIRQWYYTYMIENVIFKLNVNKGTTPLKT